MELENTAHAYRTVNYYYVAHLNLYTASLYDTPPPPPQIKNSLWQIKCKWSRIHYKFRRRELVFFIKIVEDI